MEGGIPVGEHPAVGGDQPVPPAVGGAGQGDRGPVGRCGREVAQRARTEGPDRVGEDRGVGAARGGGHGEDQGAHRAEEGGQRHGQAQSGLGGASLRADAQLPMGKWQATWWPGARSRISGTSSAQRASARGQRVREAAPRRRVDRAGWLAHQGHRRPGGLGVRLHRRGQQRRRVVVGRRLVEDVRRCDLAQAAEVHHGDAVTDVLDHGQVVRDEQDGQVVLLLQVLQQVEDLGLHRHVQGGHDLVADEELRLEHQRTGDADALALPTRELAGPPASVEVGVDADRLEHLVGGLPALLLGPDLPDGQGLRHDVADPPPRVQRRDGVLEDHLHLRAHRAQVPAVERGQLGVAEADLARGGPLHLHHGPPGGGLPAPGLPHEAERLALPHGEGDARHRLHRGAALVEGDVEVLDGEERVGGDRGGPGGGVRHTVTVAGAAGVADVRGNQQA